MPQDIIVNFTTKTDQLDVANQKMESLEATDKSLESQAVSTMDAYQKRDKTIKDGATSTKKSFDVLADAASKLTKSITGGSFESTFKKIRAEVGLTDKQFKIFLQNIQKQAKIDLFSAKNQTEIKQYKDLIANTGLALQKLSIEQNEVAATSVSMKSRLRELKGELQQLEDQGKENTLEFERLQIEAGKVEDQINDTNQRIKALGSDTFAFDAIISGVTGIAGAFSVAQGAAALFGSEDEDLQKALLKVNGAMAILQGLTQVQNVLQKQSTISIAISSLLRKKDATATLEQSAAQGVEAVTLEGATVATEELNVAMAANPAGIILVAIVAITGALLAFGGETETATEKMERLNKELQENYDLAVKLANFDPVLKAQQKLVDAIEASGKARAAAGASDAEQATDQLRLTQEQIKLDKIAQDLVVKNLKDSGLSYEGAKNELNGLIATQKTFVKESERLLAQREAIRKQEITGAISSVEAGKLIEQLQSPFNSKKEIQEQNKIRQQRIDFLSKGVTDFETANKKVQDDTVAAQEQVNTIIKSDQDNSLKSARAFAEAKVLIAKVGSQQALQAEIKAIRAREAEESNDPNLTPGERAKIAVQATKDIEKAENDFNRNSILQAKNAVDTKLSFAIEGTKEELELKLQSLKLGHDAEILDKTKSTDEIKAIDAKYLDDRQKAFAATNRKIAEDVINTHIAEAKASIANLQSVGADSTNADLLQAKKDLIHEQAALEILSIESSKDNEVLRAAKIKAVYAQELEDKRELERAKTQAELENELSNKSSVNDSKITRAQAELNSTKLTNKQRIALEDEVFNAQKQKLRDLQDLNVAFYAEGLKDVDAYNREKRDLETQADVLDIQREQTKEERKAAIRKQYEDLALKSISVGFDFVLAGYDREEARLRRMYDNKQISEKEFQKKSRQIQKERADVEKNLAIFQVLVSEGPAVIKGFQQGGFAGAAAALALVLSLLSTTRSTSVPGLKEGEVDIKGPGTETSDSIFARLSRGETVTTAKQTRKHRDVLEAIHNDTFGEWLKNNIVMPDLYQNLTEPNYASDVKETISNYHSSTHVNFDKEGLATLIAQKIGNMGSIARAIADMPSPSLSIDEDGFTARLRQNNDIIEFKNKKLNL